MRLDTYFIGKLSNIYRCLHEGQNKSSPVLQEAIILCLVQEILQMMTMLSLLWTWDRFVAIMTQRDSKLVIDSLSVHYISGCRLLAVGTSPI